MAENNPSGAGRGVYGFVSLIDASSEETKIFNSFTAELTDDDDAPPAYACRDAKYYLTLQREKLRDKKLSVKEKLREGGANNKVIGVMFDSPMYTVKRLSRNYVRKTEYRLDGRKIYTYKDRQVLYQTLIDAKRGIPHNASCVCPNCGAVSRIAELESGCRYCGTRFLMSELFPKVTGHYWLRGYSMSPKEMRNRFLAFLAGGIGVGLLIGLILDVSGLWRSIYGSMYPDGTVTVAAMLLFSIYGIIFGAILSTSTLFWRVIIDAVKSLGLISRVSGSKKRLIQTLRQRDPYFFYEAFESRVISLFKIMVYGKELSNNAAYFGEKPIPPSDVIEAVYRGAMEVENIVDDGNYTTVTLNFFATCLHLKGRRIVRKNDEYRMVLVRNSAAVTDAGFSVFNVECRSCGGSFDASRTRRCPHCGRDYHLYDLDWAVYSFEKRK